jgi:hypothetical protein
MTGFGAPSSDEMRAIAALTKMQLAKRDLGTLAARLDAPDVRVRIEDEADGLHVYIDDRPAAILDPAVVAQGVQMLRDRRQ